MKETQELIHDLGKDASSTFYESCIEPYFSISNWDILYICCAIISIILLLRLIFSSYSFFMFVIQNTILYILATSLFFNLWALNYNDNKEQYDKQPTFTTEYLMRKGQGIEYTNNVLDEDDPFATSNFYTWCYESTDNNRTIMWELDQTTHPASIKFVQRSWLVEKNWSYDVRYHEIELIDRRTNSVIETIKY